MNLFHTNDIGVGRVSMFIGSSGYASPFRRIDVFTAPGFFFYRGVR